MVKWIRVAACMVFLAAFLWGCSPGQADEQTAEETAAGCGRTEEGTYRG